MCAARREIEHHADINAAPAPELVRDGTPRIAALAANVSRLEIDLEAYRSNVIALASAMLELRSRALPRLQTQDLRVCEIAEVERFVAEATDAPSMSLPDPPTS